MAERNKVVPVVYIILEKDGEYLLARRYNTGYQDGNYNLPAGHVDQGELPSEAAVREAKEEIGVDIDPGDLQLVHMSYRPKHDDTGDRVDFFFKVTRWSGEVANGEPDKCDDLLWARPEAFPENMTPHVRTAFEAIAQGKVFQELDMNYLQSHGYVV